MLKKLGRTLHHIFSLTNGDESTWTTTTVRDAYSHLRCFFVAFLQAHVCCTNQCIPPDFSTFLQIFPPSPRFFHLWNATFWHCAFNLNSSVHLLDTAFCKLHPVCASNENKAWRQLINVITRCVVVVDTRRQRQDFHYRTLKVFPMFPEINTWGFQ